MHPIGQLHADDLGADLAGGELLKLFSSAAAPEANAATTVAAVAAVPRRLFMLLSVRLRAVIPIGPVVTGVPSASAVA